MAGQKRPAEQHQYENKSCKKRACDNDRGLNSKKTLTDESLLDKRNKELWNTTFREGFFRTIAELEQTKGNLEKEVTLRKDAMKDKDKLEEEKAGLTREVNRFMQMEVNYLDKIEKLDQMRAEMENEIRLRNDAIVTVSGYKLEDVLRKQRKGTLNGEDTNLAQQVRGLQDREEALLERIEAMEQSEGTHLENIKTPEQRKAAHLEDIKAFEQREAAQLAKIAKLEQMRDEMEGVLERQRQTEQNGGHN